MKNIILIGYMGAGKTTVGAEVAISMRMGFMDMDKYIIRMAHRSISRIFKEDGEETFRGMENRLCRFLETRDGMVVATGGGVVLDVDNMERLKCCSFIVYLKADIDTLYKRAVRTGSRPLAGDYGEFARMFSQREGLYESYADTTIDSGDRSVKEISKEIILKYIKS